MLCLGGGTVLERRLKPSESLLETVMMQSIVAATVFMTFALAFGQAAPPASLPFWWAVVWLLVLASLGGYVMYVYVSRHQGATAVSTLLYLTPPTTMLWVFLMFGTPVTVTGVVGLLISAAGVLLVLHGRRTTSQEKPSTELLDTRPLPAIDPVPVEVAPRVRL